MISFKRSLAPLLPCLVACLAPLLGACGDADTQFSVRYAPTFKQRDPKASTVSILGVFREGRMSPETWDDIGPRISSAFGKPLCATGYDSKLLADKSSLAAEIDDYTRENGVTDDLLGQLAPAATGDTVLVVTVAGRPVTSRPTGQASGAAPPPTPGRAMGRGRGGAGPMSGNPTSMGLSGVDRNAFEMSASLYSPSEHRSVALLTMGYSGQSGAEALRRFVEKLRTTFPNAGCVGWKMDAQIDEKKIHELRTQ